MPPDSRLPVAVLLCGLSLVGGCTTPMAVPDEQASAEIPVPVVRQGRYTLVVLSPEHAQRDLLQQLVEVSVPGAANARVGDALRHVLLRSGYRLCELSDETLALSALPLPAAHLRLGPMTLRDALQTLAGPTRTLSVDERTREICFIRHGEPGAGIANAGPASGAPSVEEGSP